MAVTAPAAMAVVKPTSRRMRVLFVINSLVYGGAETQVIALSRALAERGHEVFIHTLSDDNPRHAELVDFVGLRDCRSQTPQVRPGPGPPHATSHQ